MHASLAIIGRPNVGKSTLFNRLVGKRLALVHDTPGVTRDWKEGLARLGDIHFKLIDTPGLDDPKAGTLEKQMWEKTNKALEMSQGILFVVDGKVGITPLDKEFARLVRKIGKPVLFVANKCEGKIFQTLAEEATRFGFGEAIGISAEHGDGLADLYQGVSALLKTLPVQDDADPEEDEKPLQFAIVGRPNAGKSTLINRLIREDRLVTSEVAGTTRDAIAVEWSHKGQPIRLIDTAGMRRKARVESDLEQLTIRDALRTIKYAQVVVLMITPEEPLSKQDLVIANRVIDEGRVLVLALNKLDLVKDKDALLNQLKHKLAHELPQVKGVPCVLLSALMGKNLPQLLNKVLKSYELWNMRLSTGVLNRWLEEIVSYHPPPLSGRTRIRLKYMTQAKTRPPTFTLFCNKPLPKAYERYLLNSLREDFNLPGIPIRLLTRTGNNPYTDEK